MRLGKGKQQHTQPEEGDVKRGRERPGDFLVPRMCVLRPKREELFGKVKKQLKQVLEA